MSKKGTALATQETKDVTVADDASLFEDYAGQGLENVTGRDLLIPRLTIIQSLSPQLNPRKGEFIEGAKVGDICDVGTSELFEAPLIFLPVHFVKQWLEWAPRASGKGLVRIHDNDTILQACKPNEKKQPITPDGNYVAETAQFYGLNLSAMNRRSFIPMASTQLKRARKWLTLASSERLQRADKSEYTPPLFYRVYQLGIAAESNNEGEWFGWTVERGPKLSEMGEHWPNLRNEALAFRDSIQKGETRGDVASLATEEGDTDRGTM